jgi:hypothetical protein
MSTGTQDTPPDKVSFSEFSEAVGRGAIWGLLPGILLGVAYSLTPPAKDIYDVLSTTLLFSVFSSFSGGSLGGLIIIVDKTIKFATWSLEFLGASISSILFVISSHALSELNVLLGGLIFIILPLLLVARNYFSKESPKLIKEAIGQAIPVILAQFIIICFAFFFEKITKQNFL